MELAAAAVSALATGLWQLPPAGGEAPAPLFGACFVAFARGDAGPGRAGDRAWVAAVTWRPSGRPGREREGIEEEVVVTGTTGAPYIPGLLALREGPLLGPAVGALARRPDVLIVDATGLDHPRRAGLAVHMGAQLGLPTVGVTHRPLLARGDLPVLRRGATAPLLIGSQQVGSWVCTRTGARPVVAHAAWRTDTTTAVHVVLATSTAAARAPVPLREARRAAREARAVAEGRTLRR
ncbi:MAG TPA: endonuclease V [Acidimicrobiales bacterium]|nr:endonuclease V [Acidimicrobiales bacterium]